MDQSHSSIACYCLTIAAIEQWRDISTSKNNCIASFVHLVFRKKEGGGGMLRIDPILESFYLLNGSFVFKSCVDSQIRMQVSIKLKRAVLSSSSKFECTLLDAFRQIDSFVFLCDFWVLMIA